MQRGKRWQSCCDCPNRHPNTGPATAKGTFLIATPPLPIPHTQQAPLPRRFLQNARANLPCRRRERSWRPKNRLPKTYAQNGNERKGTQIVLCGNCAQTAEYQRNANCQLWQEHCSEAEFSGSVFPQENPRQSTNITASGHSEKYLSADVSRTTVNTAKMGKKLPMRLLQKTE